MTTTIAAERRRRADGDRAVTFTDTLRDAILRGLSRSTRISFPSARYRDDPVAFAREILGVKPWERQVEILDLVRQHKRVAVRSGHRIGKSATVGILALWFYCSFDDARVVLSSTTARQVDQILWREVKMLKARAGRCVACKADDPDGARIPTPCPHATVIDGEIGELARTGLRSRFREIVGFTARESEAIAGIAGSQLLFMIDEASGVPQFIYDAIAGNRAGGAKLVLFGNPTRNSGEFYDAFHRKSELYKTLTVSSEESPNVKAGRTIVPGLADAEWIDEMRREYGQDSAFYKVRVLGEHAEHEEGKLFSIARIAESQARWFETPEAGRLYVGIDPAGPSGTGDESAFALRRGGRIIRLVAMRGLTAEQHLSELSAMLRKHRLPRETPVVVLDRGGPDGDKVYRELIAHRTRGGFELVALRMQDRARRQPHIYHQIRDELAASLDAWMRDGGAIPEDRKLEQELHELELTASGARGLMKVTDKDKLRASLKRSPDRYDAVSLCCWEPLSLRDEAGADDPGDDDDDVDVHTPTLDPYAGIRTWERR